LFNKASKLSIHQRFNTYSPYAVNFYFLHLRFSLRRAKNKEQRAKSKDWKLDMWVAGAPYPPLAGVGGGCKIG